MSAAKYYFNVVAHVWFYRVFWIQIWGLSGDCVAQYVVHVSKPTGTRFGNLKKTDLITVNSLIQ